MISPVFMEELCVFCTKALVSFLPSGSALILVSLSLLIREHYRFACGCAACEADYPSLAAGLASKPLIMVRGMDGERGKVEELGETNFFLALKERNPAFLILNQCCDR